MLALRSKGSGVSDVIKKHLALVVGLNIMLFTVITPPMRSAPQDTWSVTQIGTQVQIAYGSGAHFAQYGALHLADSYFRLNYGPSSGWGTSLILLPAFWSGGIYYHGAPVTATWQVLGPNLVLSITGTIANLDVTINMRLSPPAQNAITALVTTTVEGTAPLDFHPGETFKPAMLSSMRISPTLWDTQIAYADCRTFSIPQNGWMIWPAVSSSIFGLQGGTSSWKVNAPTVEVTLDRSLQVTGWVTQSSDPNDDNVGFWAAADVVLPSWSYKVQAAAAPGLHCPAYLPAVQRNH